MCIFVPKIRLLRLMLINPSLGDNTEGKMAYKKFFSLMASSMATMCLCTLLFSCNNEDILEDWNQDKGHGSIRFGMAVDDDWQTRGISEGSANRRTTDRFVLRSEDSADTLCVRAIVTDGICLSGSNAEPAVTRATPLEGDDFYESFHVLAYWTKDGSLVDRFYMDTDASNTVATAGTGAIWSTPQPYYWPGDGHSFRFYAWAPTDANLTTPTNPNSTSLTYTVPDAAANQKDLVVATTAAIPGNSNATVDLSFNHICTAVKFVVGDDMQPGTINSVSLKGVKCTGTYDMATAAWTLTDATKDFTQTLNLATTGSEANGTAIIGGDATFIMLPQERPTGVILEVDFDYASGFEAAPLTAEIKDLKWEMGKTVTYELSITPEYDLEFTTIPTEVDAHYDIIPIKINAEDMIGDWTITTDQNWATIKSALTTYEKNGYWLNATGDYTAYCTSEGVAVDRQQTLTKSGSGEVEIYLFVAENTGEADRTVTLTLSKNGKVATTTQIVQKCPNWQGGIGWEVIEEGIELPYGFKWSRVVTYQKSGSSWFEEWWYKQVFKEQPSGFLAWLWSLISPTVVNYVNIDRQGEVLSVTIDYSKLNNLTTAMSNTDGQANTWGLYSYVGGTSFDGEQDLIDGGFTKVSDTGTNEDTKNFAALYAVKLNAFDVQEGEKDGQISYAIISEKSDINWYLPASGQFATGVGLNGEYWSSTAINDNTNAYSWNGAAIETGRMENRKVRAARKE